MIIRLLGIYSQVIYYILIVNIIFISDSNAQIPTTQDCKGAIPVCDYIYVEESTASGNGNYNEIPSGGSHCPNHCMDGEHNSRWYIWTVVETGKLKLEITPQVPSDDYDWAVFNLTQSTCDDIYNNVGSILSSCNAAGGPGYQGSTGINSLNGGNNDCNNGGPTNKWNADIQVWEGQTYVLVVSDWTQTPGGYTLDFSASSAVIFDDQRPIIEYIGGDLITACGTDELLVRFNENIKCQSLQASDLILEGPGGPFIVDSIYGENCDLGGNNEREYTILFNPPIFQGGDFTLAIKQFSFISDACNNYALDEVYDFNINLDSPDANAGEDLNIPYAGTGTLEGSATNGSGDYFYSWEPAELLSNPSIQNPTTITLTSSTQFILTVSDLESSCVGEDTMWVNIVGGPLGILISSNNSEICNGQRVDLSVFPDGGAGSYTYLWTSNPEGFSSTVQSPSAYPTSDTWYIVNVTDGYTDIIDSILIEVNPLPLSIAGDDQVINEGTITTLEGNASGGDGNYSYQWEPSSWLETNNIPNPTTLPLHEPTVFTLFITDGNGCISEPDNVLINASGGELSAFPLSDSTEICIGESTTITANATGGGMEYTYNWVSEPAGFTSTSSTFSVKPEVTTQYNLLLKDQFNNEYETYILITINQLPIIDLTPDNSTIYGIDTIIACVRDTIVLDAGYSNDPPNTEYFWIENSFENRLNIASTNGNWIDLQTHTVRVTNGLTGCKNTGNITILFDFDECTIGIDENSSNLDNIIVIQPNPNNGDFVIRTTESINNLVVHIYNSYGKLVFTELWEENSPAGFSKQINSEFPQGVYFMHFKSGNNSLVKKMIVK